MVDIKPARHIELHRGKRTGWSRSATLGANDGLISTSSVVVGAASGVPNKAAILFSAVAGLVAGGLSMARRICFCKFQDRY